MGQNFNMNILLITGIFPPDIGGPANFIPLLASRLTQDQYNVTVVTLGKSFSKFERDGYKVLRIRRKIPKPLRSLIAILTIFYLSKRNSYIFANGMHEEAGVGIKLAGNKKAVAKIVGDPIWERARNQSKTKFDIEEFNRNSKGAGALLERKLLTASLRQFSKVITPSSQLSRLVAQWGYSSEILTIPNGVKSIKQQNIKKVYDVVTVSRLVSWKNIDILIEASKTHHFSLLIVGDGPEEYFLKHLAGGSKYVEFYGKADEKEVLDLMQKARLFALLSDYEGMSFALLQAMALGMPVIVSGAPGNTEIVDSSENGLIVKPCTKDLVGSAVRGLLKDQRTFMAMASASVRAVEERYSIDRCLDATVKAILN